MENKQSNIPAMIDEISGYISDGIVFFNNYGVITIWNPAMERLTGIASVNASGKNVNDIAGQLQDLNYSGSDIAGESRRLIKKFFKGDDPAAPTELEFHIISLDGTSKFISIKFFLKQGSDGFSICCILREIPVYKSSSGIRNSGDALRLSEEKFSRSFHLAPISLTITTLAAGTVIEVNDEFLRNTGYTRSEVIGRTVVDVNIWETPELRERIISPLHYGKAVKNMEIVFRHKNGELHNYIFSAEPIRVEGIDCIISNFFDITERKKLEEALRISEEKFSRSFRLAPISLSVTTFETGRIVEVNDEFIGNTGYSRKDIVGKTVYDINIWEPPDARERNISPLKDGKAVKNIEIVFRHKNGDLHNYIYSAEPILLNGENCIISIFFDITEKKKLEDALRLSEEMYKTVFECTGSAMGIVCNDVLTLVNNGMVTLSGYSKKEMEGRMTWQDFVIPEYVREIRRNSLELGADEASLINKSEFKLKVKSGEVRDVYCLTALGPDDSQYVVTLIDMTEYNYLLTQINEISKREQQRVGELLHDNLIQYLTGISLIIRSLEMKKERGREIEVRDIKKIYKLIGESLTLTKKLLKGLFLVEIDYEGLPSAFKNLAASISELYEISCVFNEECGAADLDVMKATELYYIVNEAVHNAVKHGAADHIVISLRGSGGKTEIEVVDNGRGFEGKSLRDSSGLGLKLMKFRAKLIGAKITIEDNPASPGVRILCSLQK
jgi:PAS domain S-box-containing protein